MSSVDSTAESRDGSPALSDDTTTNNRSTPKEGKSLYRLYQLCFHLSIQQFFATPYVNQSTFTVHVHTCTMYDCKQMLPWENEEQRENLVLITDGLVGVGCFR